MVKTTIACCLLLLSATAIADAAQEVRCHEIAFSQAAESRDAQRFRSFIDGDARFIGSRVARGPDEIAAAWAPFFDDAGPSILWRPMFVEVLDDGALALTRGPYRMQTTDDDGNVTEYWGTFNSVWRRHGDGRWKVLFDAGSPAAEPPPDDVRQLIDEPATCDQEKMGWTMGLEPTTTGITTRGSTN